MNMLKPICVDKHGLLNEMSMYPIHQTLCSDVSQYFSNRHRFYVGHPNFEPMNNIPMQKGHVHDN